MLPLLVFVGFLVVTLGGYYLFVVRPENRDQWQLKKRLKDSPLARKRAALVKEIETVASVGSLDRLLNRVKRVVNPLRLLIEQSGLRISVSVFVLVTACAVAVPLLV